MWQTILYAIIGRPTERHSNRTEKAEEEMTNHQQQAEALFEEWVQRFAHLNDGPVFTKEDAINFAAFCLEKNGWKKYPDEKPTEEGITYLVYVNGEYHEDLWKDGHWWRFPFNVEAWRPIPEYKP